MDKMRRRTRIKGRYEAELVLKGQTLKAVTENLSLKGMLCEIDEKDAAAKDAAPGDECRVAIPLASDLTVRLDGRLVRMEGREWAVEFTGMDQDSYSHLRSMVRLSASDADMIDAEQAAPAFDDE